MSARGWLPLAVLLMALLLLPTGASTQDRGHGRKWWKDSSFRQQLQLTDDQSSRIDSIYQSTVPRLRQQYDESRAEEKRLEKLLTDATESTEVVSQEIDKAEEAHCAFNKTRVLMLYQMRTVLSPDQRTKFRKVHDDWERARHKGNGRGHDEG